MKMNDEQVETGLIISTEKMTNEEIETMKADGIEVTLHSIFKVMTSSQIMKEIDLDRILTGKLRCDNGSGTLDFKEGERGKYRNEQGQRICLSAANFLKYHEQKHGDHPVGLQECEDGYRLYIKY